MLGVGGIPPPESRDAALDLCHDGFEGQRRRVRQRAPMRREVALQSRHLAEQGVPHADVCVPRGVAHRRPSVGEQPPAADGVHRDRGDDVLRCELGEGPQEWPLEGLTGIAHLHPHPPVTRATHRCVKERRPEAHARGDEGSGSDQTQRRQVGVEPAGDVRAERATVPQRDQVSHAGTVPIPRTSARQPRRVLPLSQHVVAEDHRAEAGRPGRREVQPPRGVQPWRMTDPRQSSSVRVRVATYFGVRFSRRAIGWLSG